MTEETEQWLGPMLRAVHAKGGNSALSRLIDSALINDGLNWVQFGQVIRSELVWDDYPAVPPTPSGAFG